MHSPPAWQPICTVWPLGFVAWHPHSLPSVAHAGVEQMPAPLMGGTPGPESFPEPLPLASGSTGGPASKVTGVGAPASTGDDPPPLELVLPDGGGVGVPASAGPLVGPPGAAPASSPSPCGMGLASLEEQAARNDSPSARTNRPVGRVMATTLLSNACASAGWNRYAPKTGQREREFADQCTATVEKWIPTRSYGFPGIHRER